MLLTGCRAQQSLLVTWDNKILSSKYFVLSFLAISLCLWYRHGLRVTGHTLQLSLSGAGKRAVHFVYLVFKRTWFDCMKTVQKIFQKSEVACLLVKDILKTGLVLCCGRTVSGMLSDNEFQIMGSSIWQLQFHFFVCLLQRKILEFVQI